MRATLSRWWNDALDFIALCLFPANKPTRFRLGTHQIHSTEITVAIYTLLIGVGLAWYFANWLWFPATVLCMALAWMMMEWML
jgi:hypothetical protein